MQNASTRRSPALPPRLHWSLAAGALVELGLLLLALALFGAWPVGLWTVGSGLVGAALLLRNGARDVVALLELWYAPSGGARGLALARADSGDGVLRVAGAVGLLLPGLLTDALGLALCVPLVRRRIILALGRRGPHRVSRRNEVRNRPSGEWQSVREAPRAARVDVLPPEVAPPTPFDAAAPVVIEVRPTRRGGDR